MTDRRPRLLVAVLALVAAFSLTNVSSAQSKAFVLRDKAVQTELALTPEQIAEIEAAAKRMRPGRAEMQPFLDRLAAAENSDAEKAIRVEMSKEMDRLKEQAAKDVEKVLNEKQNQRFTQVMIQKIGPRTLLMDEYGAGLDLSDDQKTKLKKLISDRDRAVRSAMRQPKETREKITADWDKKVLSGLNEKQQAVWAQKSGKSVAFAGVVAKVANPEPGTDDAATGGSAAPAVAATNADGLPEVISFDGEPKAMQLAQATATPRTEAKPFSAISTESPAGTTAGFAKPVGKEVKDIQFVVQNASWKRVLESFAKKAGYTLDLTDIPTGTFTHRTPSNERYSVTQALDIMNGYLLRRGYILVRKDNFLICLKYDNGIQPNLIPRVSLEDLANRGDNELVRVEFPIDGLDVVQTANEVVAMIGPYGYEDIDALSASKKLIVTDLASTLRYVKTLLDDAKSKVSPDTQVFRQIPLEHVDAEEAVEVLKAQFGQMQTVPNVSAATQPSRQRGGSTPTPTPTRAPTATATTPVQITAEVRTNSVFMTGTTAQLDLAGKILEAMDVDKDAFNRPVGRSSKSKYLEVYKIGNSDTGETTKTISALMPGVVVNEDTRTKTIHINATRKQHEEVQSLLRQLDGGGRGASSVATLFLKASDPVAVQSLLQDMFSAVEAPPVIRADLFGRRLFVKGEMTQIEEIRTLLKGMGEDGLPSVNGEQVRRGGNLRKMSLGGRDGKQILELLERLKSVGDSPLEIIPMEGSSIQNAPEPSLAPQQLPQLDENGDATAYRGRSSRLRYTAAYQSAEQKKQQIADEFDRLFAPAPQRQAPPRQVRQTPAVEELAPPTNVPDPAPQPAAAKPKGKPITIMVQDGQIILQSDNQDALNDLEDRLEMMMQAMPPKTNWTIFTLKSADATEVSLLLQDLIPESSVSANAAPSTGVLGGISGGFSSMGSSLADMTGLSALGTGPTTLRIIANPTQNSLLVSGPPHLVRDVESWIRVLDNTDDRAPKVIPVKYADVQDVEAAVSALFKDKTEAPQQRRQQSANPFAAMIGGGGGSTGGKDAGIRLTLFADTRTSELHVTADDKLFEEVKFVVQRMDDSARDANRTVIFLPLSEASAGSVQDTLIRMVPKVRIQTSSSNSSSRGGTDSKAAAVDPATAARNAMIQQMSRRAGGGGAAGTTQGGFGGGRTGGGAGGGGGLGRGGGGGTGAGGGGRGGFGGGRGGGR